MANVIIKKLEVKNNLTSKEQRSLYGNALLSINTPGSIVIDGCDVSANGYNGIEIGLNSKVNLPSQIDISNIDFSGQLSNNGILIFGTTDDAVINIKKCHFADVSNAIRLSNRTAAKNVVVNIEDCIVDKWEENQAKYAGFIILEDYTSATEDDFLEANRFGPDKLTINIKNLTYKGKKVLPESVEACTATFNKDTQVIYMCIDKVGYKLPEYDSDLYPTISFS